MSDFAIAHICLNGHVSTSKSDEFKTKRPFCSLCGELVITTCPKCETPIHGSFRKRSYIQNIPYHYSPGYSKPSYCFNCGAAFPWTQFSINAANELVKCAEQLNEAEKEDFKTSINDLLKNTPKTAVAEVKFKKYALKAGSEIAKGLKDILVDLVSETVKKSIWNN